MTPTELRATFTANVPGIDVRCHRHDDRDRVAIASFDCGAVGGVIVADSEDKWSVYWSDKTPKDRRWPCTDYVAAESGSFSGGTAAECACALRIALTMPVGTPLVFPRPTPRRTPEAT